MKFIADKSKGILGGPDSPELWSEITSHIPDSLLLKDNVKILCVAFGHGTEADVLVARMQKLGIPNTKIKESIHLIDLYKVFTKDALRRGYINVTKANFLEWQPKFKFDIIVGNPPCAAPNKGDYSYWARFVDRSYSFLKNNGCLAMIIPAGWMSPTNDIRQGKKSILRDIFAKENTSHICIDPNLGNRYFRGIGQMFSYFVMFKQKYSQTTTLDLGHTSIQVDLQKVTMLPKFVSEHGISIMQKITDGKEKWNFKRYIMPESWDDISFEKTKDKSYARINGNSNRLDKTCYSVNPCKLQNNKKVILPYNGSKFKFVVDDGKQGCTNAYIIMLDENDSIEAAEVYFGSKLIQWLGTNKFTQYNEGSLINSLTKIPLSGKLDEMQIYKFYNLTDEEISFIESHF